MLSRRAATSISTPTVTATQHACEADWCRWQTNCWIDGDGRFYKLRLLLLFLCQRLCGLLVQYSMLALGPCLIVTVITLIGVEIYWVLALLVPR